MKNDNKTEEELLEEQAKNAIKEANQKAKELRLKAKAIKDKKLADLGRETIKFLDKQIDMNQLKDFAIGKGLIKQVEEEKQ